MTRVLLPAAILLAMLATTARADGPHWQIPNPDSDSEKDKDKKKDDEFPNFGRAEDYKSNPGNFLELDEKCLLYYQRHCGIWHLIPLPPRNPRPGKNPKGGKEPPKIEIDKKAVYLQIMSKCAQAMREVDMYCPCPDSHPMWQTEELREKMVEYAKKTWIKSTQLPPELAAACAELCVDSYVDTVRFADDAKEKRLPNRVKALWDANKIIADVLFRYALEKDPQKQRGLMGQWLKEAGKIRMGSSDLATAYETFREMTGDIPVMNNDTQARMVMALSEMGYLALARLQFHENHKNVAVQKAAKNLSDAIRARLAKPTLDNVAAHLKQIQQAPNSPAATHATSALKAMGNDAVAPLIQVVELDLLSLKKPALEALAMVSGKDFGTDLAMWKQLAEAIKNQPPPMEVKRVPKEEAADEIENEVEDIRIGIRPPRRPAEPDDE